MLPRSGTRGVMLARRRAAIFSMSSHRTPEWPRIKELIRTRIAPRTQDSGMLVDASGSRRGREGRTSVDEGKTPACWCCNSALPRARVLGVRVSASRRRKRRADESQVGHRRKGHTAAAETSADAIHALRSFYLPHNDITRLLDAGPNLRGIIQNYLRVVPRDSDKCRNGEAMAVDDDRIAVPINWVIRRDMAQEASQYTCRPRVDGIVQGTWIIGLRKQAEAWRAQGLTKIKHW